MIQPISPRKNQSTSHSFLPFQVAACPNLFHQASFDLHPFLPAARTTKCPSVVPYVLSRVTRSTQRSILRLNPNGDSRCHLRAASYVNPRRKNMELAPTRFFRQLLDRLNNRSSPSAIERDLGGGLRLASYWFATYMIMSLKFGRNCGLNSESILSFNSLGSLVGTM